MTATNDAVDELDVLRGVVRDLAPRPVGGAVDAGRRQAVCVHRFLTVEQWAAIDRALDTAPEPTPPAGQVGFDLKAVS